MRVLVVGLDGAEPKLVEEWQDHLPTLTELRSRGVWGKLNSTTPAVTGPAWLSFASGLNPGKHGYYYWGRRRPGTYEFEPLSARAIHNRAIWELLSRAGHRVGLVNVPATYPPAEVNGVLIAGLGVPSKESDYTYPYDLKPILESKFGYSAPEAPDFGVLDADTQLRVLKHNVDIQLAVSQWLMQEQSFDFFMVVFGATDLAQHFFWTDNDPFRPLHDKRSSIRRFDRAILETYIQIDNAVARLLQCVGDDVNVFVMSDHGFGPQYGIWGLNRWLQDRGYLSVRGYKCTRLGILALASSLFERIGLDHQAVCKFMKWVSAIGLKNTRLGEFLTRITLNFRRQFPAMKIDWFATQAYSASQDAIYLNIKGREPAGMIELADVDTVIAKLTEELLDVRHPQTGEPLVLDVRRKEEIYEGPHLPSMPDLILSLKEGYQTRPHFTTKLLVPPECGRTGCHRQHGIFIACGPDIQQGCNLDADIMDIAPTIAHLMGIPVPRYMDGRVLREIFATSSSGGLPVRYASYDDYEQLESGLSAEEEALVTEHLRGLGYL